MQHFYLDASSNDKFHRGSDDLLVAVDLGARMGVLVKVRRVSDARKLREC